MTLRTAVDSECTLLEKLGEGSFGRVYKACIEELLVAVKIVPVAQDTGEVTREIETLRRCQSPDIVQYYGSLQRGGELWIVMEFCVGSSLWCLHILTCGTPLMHTFTQRVLTGRSHCSQRHYGVAGPMPLRGSDCRGDGGGTRRVAISSLAESDPP